MTWGSGRGTFPQMNPQIPYTPHQESTTGLWPNAYDSLTQRISKLEQRLLTPATGPHGWAPDKKFDNLFPTAGDNLWDRVTKLELRLLNPVAGNHNRFSPFEKVFSTLLPLATDTPEIRVAKLEQRI